MTGKLAPRRSIAGVYTMSAKLKSLQEKVLTLEPEPFLIMHLSNFAQS